MLKHNLARHEDLGETTISVVKGLSGVLLYSRATLCYLYYLLCSYVTVIRRTVNASIKFRRRLDLKERGAYVTRYYDV